MKEMSMDDFIVELGKVEKDVIKNVEVGVNEVAEDLLSVSQKLAPLDEAGLMESGTVEPAKNTFGEIKASVGYNKEYALRMHEDFYNLGETSRRKPRVDGMEVGRKYLERPFVKYEDKYAEHITKRMGEGFE